MRTIQKHILGLLFYLTVLSLPTFAEDIILRARGSYLAYSYDLNQLYGENVAFHFLTFEVTSRYLIMDIRRQLFCAYGTVSLEDSNGTTQGEEFWFSPIKGQGVLLAFGETVLTKDIGNITEADRSSLIGDIQTVTLAQIQQSMVYFTMPCLELTKSLEVHGYRVSLFIEGTESVGFEKLNLTAGLSGGFAGLSLEKIWYSKAQGLIARLSHSYEKTGRVKSFSRLNYEEHSLAKNYVGLKRQFDLTTALSADFAKNLSLAINGNYNSSNLWNANMILNKKWNEKATAQADFSYNKPVQFKGEAWLGLRSGFNLSKFGAVSVGGKFGSDNQLQANMSYSNVFFKNINVLLSSSFTKLRIIGTDEAAKLWTGNLSVSYSSKVFNLASNYYLNRDLIGQRKLSQPQLTMEFAPFSLYDGLLSARFANIFILNESASVDLKQRTFSNNMMFNLVSTPLFLQKTTSLNLSLSLEQFLEKEKRNFTSAGLIVRVRKELSQGITLEGFYSLQNRRRTKGWLIEGTTSQDLSIVFRLDKSKRLSTWISVSFDPKYSEWRTSFADVTLGIAQAWSFHCLASYDFMFKKINNVDLYLIREAGRFQLRFVWRSLSRQFLIELTPR